MTDTITIRVRLAEASKFAGEAHIVSAEIDEIGDAAARANRKSRGAAGGLNILQKSAKLLKPALILTGIGLFTQAMNAGMTGAFAFAASLAPLAGLLGALPGAFMIAAQGAGVLKLAFKGIGGALGPLNGELDPKKFALLSTQGQQFVLMLDSMKKPIIALQSRLQAGLLPGLTKGLQAARPVLSALTKPLEGTARVFGSLGDHLGHLVGSKGFLSDLRSQAQFNNVQLTRLGGGALHLVDAFRQIMVVSRPLVGWLVRLTSGWAASADKSLIAGRQSGKLAGIFRTVRQTTSSVLKVLGNVGKLLWNIGVIGRKSLGTSLLQSLVKGSTALKRWSESGPGIAKITHFFAEAKPAVYAFAKLFGALVVDFLKLGTGGKNGGLTTLLNKLRTESLPLLLKVTEGLVNLFGLIARNVPGGTWLLTIGFLLSKLGGGGLISGIANGLGRQFGITMAAGLFGQEAGFIAAGTALGTAFEVALAAAAVVGVAILAVKIGEKLAAALNPTQYVDPSGKPVSPGQRKHKESVAGQIIREGKSERARGQAIREHKPFTIPTTSERQQEREMYRGHREPYTGGVFPTLTPGHHGASFSGPTLRAPTTTTVRRSTGGGAGGATPVHIHSHTTLVLKDKPIAEGTNEVVARLKALA
jgi:hypothetical protein